MEVAKKIIVIIACVNVIVVEIKFVMIAMKNVLVGIMHMQIVVYCNRMIVLFV